ncbi:MAG: glycine cleavage T C-terminal barrel domain-containing protein [Phycisphaerales bacterium]|jgi:folate-binding protein YgfZ|nr:glycine cleavage T C-terminal barrel domain-containing protein [Phycisphaerales bacterium]
MPLREHHRLSALNLMRSIVDRTGSDRPGAATASLAGGEPEYLDWGDGEERCETVATLGGLEVEYAAIRSGVAVIDAAQRGVVLVRGGDAIDLLDRLLSQKVRDLKVGEAAAGFLLDRTGRIQSDVLMIRSDQGILLDVDLRDVAAVARAIEAMRFSEDVHATRGDDWYTLEAHGPDLAGLLAACGGPLPQPGCCVSIAVEGITAIVTRWDTAGTSGVRIHVPRTEALRVWEALHEHGMSAGMRLRTVGWLAFNMARVESRTPWWHIDFGEQSLPHETGLLGERVSFTKGCYPGQEVVARMEHLGHPKQILRALVMPDERLPIAGGQVFVDEDGSPGDPVGVVTSSAPSPMRGNRSIAMAVLKWAHASLGTSVRCVADGDMVSTAVELAGSTEKADRP